MTLENPFYSPEVQGGYELHSLGRFELEEGGVIPDLQLAVATYGTLNEAKLVIEARTRRSLSSQGDCSWGSPISGEAKRKFR